MQYTHLIADIELTNRCNALCSFCPRDKTPTQGMISREVFYKAVSRVAELESPPRVSLTGQGEPTLHPDLPHFIAHVKKQGLHAGMTTNASLMKPELAEQVLGAGLDKISFSVSNFGEDYHMVYNLDFDNSLNNILHFLDINNGRCEVGVNIVHHDLNKKKIGEMVNFWREKGIEQFTHFRPSNRGGACENGRLSIGNSDKLPEAEALMRERGITSLCDAAFLFLFVGWTGHYYICCNDYQKTTRLGHVSELGFSDLNEIKLKSLACGSVQACVDCDLDPVNKVRESLLEVEHGLADEAAVEETLQGLTKGQKGLPNHHSDIDWKIRYLEGGENLIARSGLG